MVARFLRIAVVCAAVVLGWDGMWQLLQRASSLPEMFLPPVSQPPLRPPQSSLTTIKKRGTITFLLHHSAASHFLYNGAQMGFEYELAQSFAKELGVELEVLTPPPGVNLATWLRVSNVDIAAGLAVTDYLDAQPLQISTPYLETTAQVLIRSADLPPRTVAALADKVVAIQPDAFYAHRLFSTPRLLIPPLLMTTRGTNTLSEAVVAVRDGKAEATVMPTPLAGLAQTLYPGTLRTAGTLPGKVRFVWAVRAEQADLLPIINAYLQRSIRSGFRNILFQKYFVSAAHLRGISEAPSTLVSKRLSLYDRLIAHYAEEAGFDWRLVSALIYQESRFDHTRVSEAGAIGLMQIMPIAAQEVGVTEYADLQGNLKAGVQYLSWLAKQFPDGEPTERLALILAGYLLGPGRIKDAQGLARTLGYDPLRWGDAMEQVLPLLEVSTYYQHTRNGFAPGTQAVRYVNAILRRYSLYSCLISRRIIPVRRMPLTRPAYAASATG